MPYFAKTVIVYYFTLYYDGLYYTIVNYNLLYYKKYIILYYTML